LNSDDLNSARLIRFSNGLPHIYVSVLDWWPYGETNPSF
jgi:hypothetical protein